MKKAQTLLIETEGVTKLSKLLEESTRASAESVKYFLEPAQGVLSRAVSKRHHIIFGRRGSGKSSLLKKVVSDLTVNRTPIGYVDLEQFKGHSYPDVLVSILIKALSAFREWLDTAAINPANKTTFWKKLFGATPKATAFNKNATRALSDEIGQLIKELTTLLTQADGRKLRESSKIGSVLEDKSSAAIEAGVHGLKGSTNAEFSSTSEDTNEIESEYTHRKIEALHQNIMRYKDLFERISVLAGGASFLLLDDLYHLRRADQANVVDYFHRIAKGSKLWLKIGTIRHRSRYYYLGDPPIGMKLGDDADEIDLDITLEKFDSTKKFLMRILGQFAEECSVNLDDLLTDGAKDRLILASGGVARDFLTIFRRALDVARERNNRGRTLHGEKIGVEDVNVAAGSFDDFKREDFNRDTESSTDRDILLSHFDKIVGFCIKESGANCFLVEKDYKSDNTEFIANLVDLKLLHRAKSRVTVRTRKGKLYDAYMLDISQYTGERTRRNFTMVKFWGQSSDDVLRKASYIFAEKAT